MAAPAIQLIDVTGDKPSIVTCDLIVSRGAVQSVTILSLVETYRNVDLLMPGLPGKQGEPGKDGEDGEDGKDGIATLLELPFEFPFAATTWSIQHDLGRRPDVRVLTGDGTRIYPGIRYIDGDRLEIGFYWPMSGKAYIT